MLVWIGWNGDQNWSGVISLCSGYDGSLKGPCWRDPSDIGDGSRGLYPSAPVIILPVNAIAGGLELGDVVGPAVVDRLATARVILFGVGGVGVSRREWRGGKSGKLRARGSGAGLRVSG